jgi:diguanylate cyclase (GGDEF)-like protein
VDLELALYLAITVIGLLIARLVSVSANVRRLETELAAQVVYDPITRLPNRAAFMEAGSRACAVALRYDRPCSIAILDIKGLRAVNDSLGSSVGDEVLETVAERAIAAGRSADMLARLGGSELALLMPDTAAEEARAGAQCVCEEIGRVPLHAAEGSVRISVRYGVATMPPAAGLDDLIARADADLYGEPPARARNSASASRSPSNAGSGNS